MSRRAGFFSTGQRFQIGDFAAAFRRTCCRAPGNDSFELKNHLFRHTAAYPLFLFRPIPYRQTLHSRWQFRQYAVNSRTDFGRGCCAKNTPACYLDLNATAHA